MATQSSENTSDGIHISDDDDDDGNKEGRPVEGSSRNPARVCDLVAKGWKTCSTGFQNCDGYQKEILSASRGTGKFSPFTKISSPEWQGQRRKSAPPKLSNGQLWLTSSKENFNRNRQSVNNIDVLEDIEASSSPEEADQCIMKTHKKWKFTDLSNNFSTSDCTVNKVPTTVHTSKFSSPVSSKIKCSKEISISTKIPRGERFFNKIDTHSDNSKDKKRKSEGDACHSAIGRSSLFGSISFIRDSNTRAAMHGPRNPNLRNKSILPNTSSRKRVRVSDDSDPVLKSKSVVFKRWIKSLAEHSTLLPADGTDVGLDSGCSKSLTAKRISLGADKSKYVEHLLKSSRATTLKQDEPSPIGDQSGTQTLTGGRGSLPLPMSPLLPPKPSDMPVPSSSSHSNCKYVETIVPSSSVSTCSGSGTGPFTVSHDTQHISTPTSSAVNPSQVRSSRSPVISTPSPDLQEQLPLRNDKTSTLTSGRKSSLSKSRLPVCSTTCLDVAVKSIGTDVPDFSESNLKTDDGKIEPYNFGSMREVETEADIEDDFDNGTQASVHISSAESQSSSTRGDDNVPGQKCSEWLQNLNWRKSCVQSDGHGEHLDKQELKYQSLLPGGLAECAWKLEKKEKSTRVIWSYKRMQKLKSSLHKALTVKMESLTTADSVLLTRCKILKVPALSQTVSPATGVSVNSDAPKPSDRADFREGGQCFLLIRSYSTKDMHLRPGNVLHIFPPWQNLDIPSLLSPVILCAFFVQVEEKSSEDQTSDKNDGCLVEDVIYPRKREKESGDLLQCELAHLPQINPSATKTSKKTESKSKTSISEPLHEEQDMSLACEAMNPNEDAGRSVGASETSPCERRQKVFIPDMSNVHTFASALNDLESVFPVCARVQRIWCHVVPASLVQHKLKTDQNTAANSPADIRYSLLLQDSNMQFCELQITGYQPELHRSWADLLEKGEGKCFRFEDIKILESLPRTRHPLLFSYLRELVETEQEKMKIVCFKASASCSIVSVSDVAEESLPPFVPYKVDTLDRMFVEHKVQYRRITCAAKILCHAFDTYFVVDESVRQHKLGPYVKMKFCPLSFKPASVRVGSVIAIVDGVIQKGVLYVDRYSRVSLVSPLVGSSFMSSSQLSNRLGISPDEAIALTFFTSSKCSWKSVSPNSRVSDLVVVEGMVSDVDKETAVSWLECNMCGGEDLYHDSESRIFCASCEKEVDQPKMLMKMSVSVKVRDFNSMVANIELNSATAKRILCIPEADLQPQCNVTDILEKPIGPVFCYVKTKKIINNVVHFELAEVSVR